MTQKVCTKCGVPQDLNDFVKNKRRPDGRGSWCKSCHNKIRTPEENRQKVAAWRVKNPARVRLNNRNSRIRAKLQAIEHYGGKCSCCGEAEPEFLAIDHIDGRGKAHRTQIGINGGWRFYTWLRQRGYPEGYQVLCHNCNFSKHFGGTICVHKRLSVFCIL